MARKGNIECDAVHYCVGDAGCKMHAATKPTTRRAPHVQERKVLAAPGLVNEIT